MRMVHASLCLCLGLSLAAGTPDKNCRSEARESAYQGLVRQFGVPKAYWNASQVAAVPGELRSELRSAVARSMGCIVLGTLDCIDDLDKLTQEETVLLAQVAWSECFYKEGERLSRGSALGTLFRTLDLERRGRTEKGGVASIELLKADGFHLIRQEITWIPLRGQLLEPIVEGVLADDDFLFKGRVPKGFDPGWLEGSQGRKERWDRAWAGTWGQPDPRDLAQLLDRMRYYRPEGLETAQAGALEARLLDLQNLPYDWAASGAPLADTVLPSTFWDKIRAAKLSARPSREAAATLGSLATTPRDFYELSRIQESLGTESDLKLLLDAKEQLLMDPGLAGWSPESARTRIQALDTRYTGLVATRIAEETRLAEVERKADEAERKVEAASRARELRVRLEARMSSAVAGSLDALVGIAKSFIQKDRRGAENGVQRLLAAASGFQESQTMMTVFRQHLMEAWSSGPGKDLAGDGGLSAAEKAEVGGYIRRMVNGLSAVARASADEAQPGA